HPACCLYELLRDGRPTASNRLGRHALHRCQPGLFRSLVADISCWPRHRCGRLCLQLRRRWFTRHVRRERATLMTVDSKEVLRITTLTVNFQSEGQRIESVRGVNLHVRRGRVLALVGESGSGKSVTAMSVLGLLPRTATTSGSIQLAAEEI